MKEYIVTIVRYDGSDKKQVRIMAYAASTAMHEAEDTYKGFIAKSAKAAPTRKDNPLFGFLTSRKGYQAFKQTPRGKVTYHRSKKADRKAELKEARELGLGTGKKAKKVARIVSAGRKSKPRKSDKELLDLFGNMEFDKMDNPSLLRRGIKGTVKLIGSGRNARLEIHT
jgi:hypothetical protein